MDTLKRLVDAGVFSKREGQQQTSESFRKALTANRIGLFDVPTANGKKVAYLAAAQEFLETQPEASIAVALPNLALVEQALADWQTIQAAAGGPDAVCILGKDEFVSVDRLGSMLETEKSAQLPNVSAVREWVAGGGLAPSDALLKSPWLMRSLRRIAPGFPDVSLREHFTGPSDQGMLAYQEQLDSVTGSRLLIITHSVLADDTLQAVAAGKQARRSDPAELASSPQYVSDKETERRNVRTLLSYWPTGQNGSLRLPAFSHLIVDEVHLLEEAFAAACTLELPFYSILKQLSKLKLPAADRRLVNSLHNLKPPSGNHPIELQRDAQLRSKLASLSTALKKDKTPYSEYAVAAIELAERASGLKGGAIVQIRFSSNGQFPRLTIGVTSIAPLLRDLWRQSKGALLLSSSIAVPRVGGGHSFSHTCRQLGIDDAPEVQARMLSSSIPCPGWTTNPVTLVQPARGEVVDGIRSFLHPVSRSDTWKQRNVEERTWLDEVAATIMHAADSAKGGTLVLCTSYETVTELSQLLGSLSDRLVVDQRKLGMLQQRQLFIDKHSQALRPVWLAARHAWTGLELVDQVEPEYDTLLTDLVLPRLPIGMNAGISNIYRKKQSIELDSQDAAAEMSFWLRQGIGRLVRRKGVKDRRLWMLDARIHSRRFASFTAPVQGVLGVYHKRIELREKDVSESRVKLTRMEA